MFKSLHLNAWVLPICLIILVVFTACERSGPHMPKPAESITPSEAGLSVTFSEVAPVLQNRCARCHDWTGKEKDRFISLAADGKNSKVYNMVITTRAMPKQDPEKSAITEAERQLIGQYVLSLSEQQPISGDGFGIAQTLDPELEKLSKSHQFALLQQCSGCHGVLGQSQMDQVPNLAGQLKPYLVSQLEMFRSGERVDSTMNVMNEMASQLTDEHIDFFGAHFSLSSPKPSTVESVEVSASIVEIAKDTCFSCHSGQSDAVGPLIHGQKPQYILNQLEAFKSGKRTGEIMPSIMEDLEVEIFADLAKYIGAQAVPVEGN